VAASYNGLSRRFSRAFVPVPKPGKSYRQLASHLHIYV
jgi:hypothetical protein